MRSLTLLVVALALICSVQASCGGNITAVTSDPVSATLSTSLNCTYNLGELIAANPNKTFFAVYSSDHNITASNGGAFSVQTDTTEEQYACLGPLVSPNVYIGVADMVTPGADDDVDFQYYVVTGSCDASSIDWDTGIPVWVWILVVVGVVLIIVAVVAVIAGYVFWKKKKEAEESDLHTFEDA